MENKLREIKKEFEGLYYWRYVVPKKDRMSAQEYNKRFESLINEHYERKEENAPKRDYAKELLQLKVGDTITFDKKNNISYTQDFGFYKGVPHGILFEVIEMGKHIKVVADGYGKKGRYGNGALYLKTNTDKEGE